MKIPQLLRERDLNEVLCMIHAAQLAAFRTAIEIEGVTYSLTGKPVNVLSSEIPVVEILTQESTPQEPHLRKEAIEEFISSVENIAETKTKFATMLRIGWAIPAVEWSIEKYNSIRFSTPL